MTAETLPGPAAEDDAALLAYAQAHGSTVYHAVGTCRMGADPLAVVAPLLRLRGLGGLRAADAPVMPTMVSANTNATIMMVAERAAAIVPAERRGALAAA